MLKYLLISVMALGVMSIAVRVSTNALFTDSQSVGANAFTTGTLDLSTSKTSAALALSGMAPGDQVVAPITIDNSGSLALRYAVVSTTTENVLSHQMVLTVKSGVTSCDASSFDASGTQLYSGILGSTGGTDIIGDPATGQQSGDRTLASGASETLCFRAQLPLSTGNSYQGLSTAATFSFVAEQTKNNS